MKRFHITLFCVIASLQIAAGQDRDIHVFAHRGCWSKDAEGAFIVPENSIAAVAEAARRGYEGTECDVRLTKDGTAGESIVRLQQIGGRCGISTMKYGLYTPEFCKALTDAGYEVQASVFPFKHEKNAIDNGITYLLTDRVLPSRKWKRIKIRH